MAKCTAKMKKISASKRCYCKETGRFTKASNCGKPKSRKKASKSRKKASKSRKRTVTRVTVVSTVSRRQGPRSRKKARRNKGVVTATFRQDDLNPKRVIKVGKVSCLEGTFRKYKGRCHCVTPKGKFSFVNKYACYPSSKEFIGPVERPREQYGPKRVVSVGKVKCIEGTVRRKGKNCVCTSPSGAAPFVKNSACKI